MRPRSKQICRLILCIAAVLMLLPTHSFAAGLIDTAARTSLTVSFTLEDGTPAPGVEFRLYKVADMSANGTITVADTFAGYAIDFTGMEGEDWNRLVTTLQGYIAADGIQPAYKAVTDAQGAAVFADLPIGIYLAEGDIYHAHRQFITPAAFIIDLPKRVIAEDGSGDIWKYDVTADCKPDEIISDAEEVEIEVLKVWKDDDYSGRPGEVTIELYDGTELYDTVVLNKENNWKHKWTGLYGGTTWTVKEKEVPQGYTVVVEQQGNRMVVNNSRPTPPPAPTPTPQPGEPTPTPPPTAPPKLPQTGMLWWPVPTLSAAGMILLLLGILRRRGAEDEEE